MISLVSALFATALAAEPTVLVGPQLRTPTVDLSDEARDALREERWDAAVAALGDHPPSDDPHETADWAFLRGWALTRADRAADAVDLLDDLDATRAPAPYVDVLRSELLLASGDLEGAAETLASVPDTVVVHGRAMLARAALLGELGRPEEAEAVYREMITRDDPAEGNPEALLALAERTEGDERQQLLRRVWYAYPRSDHSIAAVRAMGPNPPGPTWQQVSKRSEALAGLREWDAIILETGRVLAAMGDDRSDDGCRLLYNRGRAYYKKNQVSNSISAFEDAGERCTEASDAWGARALYIQGMGWFRKSRYEKSAEKYQAITALYPEHSMADDGLTRAGIALQENGDQQAAQALWRRALDELPDGDTVPEATFRLAFTLYLDGEVDEARTVARRLGKLDLSVDPVHVAAGRYWDARWALYPDAENPSTPAEAGRDEAIAGWRSLVETWPHSFYAILAYSRLLDEAPEVAAQLSEAPRQRPNMERPWRVRLSTIENPATRAGIDLARVGLIRAAVREWDTVGTAHLTGDEMAWQTELRIAAGDWLHAHDRMRWWMRTHPPGTLGENEAEVLRVAYPDHYWSLVREASDGDSYDSRLFHALVREESNFNTEIRSHAGARGLSQLMPATAKQTAGWLGMQVSMAQLRDPATNLTIGAHYLDRVLVSLDGSPYLALAGYNAGSGRVRQWLGEWGNVPTDEFVERIPYRETRGYVKRVMGTWQTYRYAFDEGALAVDLSKFNHQSRQD